MRRLSLIIVAAFKLLNAQSPHTEALETDCSVCHNPDNWSVDIDMNKFDHSGTGFDLTGQHIDVDCRTCHNSLIFSEAQTECFSCHTDIHQNSVGNDCSRCHKTSSWIVTDIIQLHEVSRFPLLGTHLRTDCIQCHINYGNLYFEPLDIQCISCHEQDYRNTASPSHILAGFSTECQDCHMITSPLWAADNFIHDFFPLTGGHHIANCFSCHRQGNYSGLSADCYSCHRIDYENARDPDHLNGNFPFNCTQCHNINGWSPSEFDHNLTNFALTGAHLNTQCTSCHQQSYTGTPVDCFSCHNNAYNSAVNPDHRTAGISTECGNCHGTVSWIPSGFDHSSTGFQLLGEHAPLNCSTCHTGTTSGLNQECVSCHQPDYNSSINPNHAALAIPSDCQSCHMPTPEWEPASFPIHNNYYELIGAHAVISTSCISCHNGNYNNTPNTCFGCHAGDYNNTTNPVHSTAGFSTDCLSCHSQSAWKPASFDHDNQYFPIYSGKHQGKWTNCSDCHTNQSSFAQFSCLGCHEHNQTDMDQEHQGISGYSYESNACFSCHPAGDSEGAFNHSLSDFPLTGAHLNAECIQCHTSGYSGTTMICSGCHQSDFNSTTNPDHEASAIPTDCADCHSTNPDWQPASFPIHNNYYELTGAHTSSGCSACHQGNYNSTPDQCYSCHQNEYNSTTNPQHSAAGFPFECEECHSQSAWIPSSFNHDDQFFPIYSGEHREKWNSCSDCHTSFSNFSQFSCIDCHEHNQAEMNDEHSGVQDYVYESLSCFNCHPRGNSNRLFRRMRTE